MQHVQPSLQKSASSLPLGRPVEAITGEFLPREAAWNNLPMVRVEPDRMAANRVDAANNAQGAASAFDLLRTRVLHLLRQNNWTTVGITSPASGAGTSMVALNLAYSVANCEGCHVVLMDLDLRQPHMATALGLTRPPLLERYLRGGLSIEEAFCRLRPNFALAANARRAGLTSELLQSAGAARVFREMKHVLTPDVVICALPPMLVADDTIAFLPNLDCAILVAEAERDTLDCVDACERELASQTNVLGVVLNKCRHDAADGPRTDGGRA